MADHVTDSIYRYLPSSLFGSVRTQKFHYITCTPGLTMLDAETLTLGGRCCCRKEKNTDGSITRFHNTQPCLVSETQSR